MKSFTSVAALGLAASASAQSICSKYATALLGNDTAANQATLLTLVVNTAVIGNYTTPNVGIAVPGILAPGYYMGEAVNLLPYFDGSLASSNRGGPCGVAVNFLDDGGAAPLMMNKPSNTDTSNQYMLLTHLYQFFAVLLGCTEFGTTVTPYAGFNGMYEVHKFMALSSAEFGWFVEQVGLAAASFGVTDDDVQAVGTALSTTFGMRYSPPAAVPPYDPAELQAICTECDCPVSTTPDYEGYGPVIEPLPAAESGQCGPTEYCNANEGSWNWWGHQWGNGWGNSWNGWGNGWHN